MDFDWLEARRAGGRVDRAAWRQMLCEKAALLARLSIRDSKSRIAVIKLADVW